MIHDPVGPCQVSAIGYPLSAVSLHYVPGSMTRCTIEASC